MRFLPSLLGWLVLLAAGAIIAVARAPAERDPSSVGSLLAYPLDGSVRFALEPGEREVLLSTRLLRPPGRWPADPRVQERWCLDLAVEGPDGAPIRAWRAWVAGRTSVTEDDDGRFRPRAWIAAPDTEVSLSRGTRVDLDGVVPQGGVLSVRAGCLADGERLLASAARRGSRGEVARLRLATGDGAAFRAEAAARLGALDWRDLPGEWRQRLLADVWERLGALPPAGGGVNPTVRLSVSLDDPPDAADALRTALVPAGGAVAFNLRGPASFSGTWAKPDGTPAPAPRAEARAVLSDGTVRALPLGDDGALGPWRFDDPLVSVQIALAPGQPPLRIRGLGARVDADPAWGDPPRREVAPGRHAIGPEHATVEMARVQEGAPVRFSVARGEVVRLQFRVPLPPATLAGFTPVTPPTATCPTDTAGVVCVVVEAEGADGAVLARHDVALAPVASAFERYVLGDTPGSAAVGEAEARVFVLPEGTAGVRVASARRVDVSARVTTEGAGSAADEPGYELPPGAEVRRRFAPLDREGWRARSPDAFDDLAAQGRIVRLDGQVRLEPAPREDAPDDADAPDDEAPAVATAPYTWHALPLDAPYALVAQADADPDPGTPGAHVRLSATPATVPVPDDGRLAVAYRVDPARVGEEVVFRVGPERIARRLAAAGDVLELGPFPPGPTRVVVDGAGLFLARGEGAPAWRARRVWAAEDLAAATIRVPPGAGALMVHAYLAPGDTAWLGVAVTPDGDTPAGAYAGLTDRGRLVTLAPDRARGEALPLTFAGAPLLPVKPVVVRLADDLVRGGTVAITVDGARSPVWVRLSGTWDAGVAAVARHWRRGAPR